MSDRRSTNPGSGEPLADMFEVRLTDRPDVVQKLFEQFDVDVGCRHPDSTRNEDGTLTVLVYATEQSIKEMQEAGYAVERGENVSALGRERQGEVGKGDRFEGGRTFPEGIGKLVRDGDGRTAS